MNKKISNYTKDIQLPNRVIEQIIQEMYYNKLMEKTEEADININHLENIFTNDTYYTAMKIVPLLEKKVLYLAYVENVRLNDICKRLKLQKREVISLRNKGIMHFKYNLQTLYKANKQGGGK